MDPKWHYEIEDNLLSSHYTVKWWVKFSSDRIIKFINEELPQGNKLKKKEEKSSTSKSSIESILEGKSTKELAELAACQSGQPTECIYIYIYIYIHVCVLLFLYSSDAFCLYKYI